jgi:CheY-like chemotaxis protein
LIEKNNRILIVDDNEAIHQDFRKILKPRGSRNLNVAEVEASLFDDDPEPEYQRPTPVIYELDFAFNANQALSCIEEAEAAGRPYAVVFTDVRMPPGPDGVQLVEKIIARAPYTEIVIVTAYADYSWEELIDRFGWTDRLLILRKPFDGITIKQIASTLTRKWMLGMESRQWANQMTLDLDTLERIVEERTAKLADAYKELQNFA